MRPPFALALVLLVAACTQPPQRTRTGPVPTGVAGPGTPEQIIAPSVPLLPGLPHALRIGFTVYVSGMVPVDSAGRLIGPGDLRAQTGQALINLGAVMRAARGVPGDVVRLTVYVRNLTPDAVATVRGAVLEGLERTSPPALTVVGVSALPEPGMLMMLDATAQLRAEFPDRERMGMGGRGGKR